MSICQPCHKGGELSRTAAAAKDSGITTQLLSLAQKEHLKCPEYKRQNDETLSALTKVSSALCDCQHEMSRAGTSGRA